VYFHEGDSKSFYVTLLTGQKDKQKTNIQTNTV